MKKISQTMLAISLLLMVSLFAKAQQTVTIGAQTWMLKNLDVNSYSDGTTIPEVTDPTAWSNLTTGAWCYFSNNPNNNTEYGKLYNWYAVAGIYDSASFTNPSLRKQLAPAGYHVPSKTEWVTLSTFLGGDAVAGAKMKEAGTTHWNSPNTGSTNSSGFTGLPGGNRENYDGVFYNLGKYGGWWGSTQGTYYNSEAYSNFLFLDKDQLTTHEESKRYGYSVRCLAN